LRSTLTIASSPSQPASNSQRIRTVEAIHEQVDWLNSLVQPVVPQSLWSKLPRFVQGWLRNYIFANAVYFGVNFTWVYYIYYCFGSNLFPSGKVPTWSDMGEQMHVSFFALPAYSLLPTITEEMCERGWTLAYGHVSDVGIPTFVALLFVYMAFVEFGVYWMHRGLHDIPAGYKCVLKHL
jgi:Delta7-sterol 5-desaturase